MSTRSFFIISFGKCHDAADSAILSNENAVSDMNWEDNLVLVIYLTVGVLQSCLAIHIIHAFSKSSRGLFKQSRGIS